MKLRLVSHNRMPYGGMYEINRPDLGIVSRGTTWGMFFDNACNYRRANSIPIGLAFDDECEQVLCESYPAECEGFDPDLPRPRRLGFADVVRGTKVMLAHKLAGSPLVDEGEARRRAAICRNCTFNVDFSGGCTKCAELRNLVVSVLGTKSTPYDNELKSCFFCGCFTKAAVWLPLEIQCLGVNSKMREQFSHLNHCWKQCKD